MREEQLIDAIGKLDADMFADIEKLRAQETVKTAEIIPIRSKKRRLRRWLMPVAACMILMLGGIAAYASGLVDIIRFGTEGKDKTIEYTPSENPYIPFETLTGEVRNVTAQMKDRLQYYLAGEPLPNDEMVGMFTVDEDPFPGEAFDVSKHMHPIGVTWEEIWNQAYMFNVGAPGLVYKPFNTMAEAEAYIGYPDLHMPSLGLEPDQLGVYVVGVTEEGYDAATADSEFDVCSVQLCAGYALNNAITAFSSAKIETQEWPETRTIVLGNSEKAVLRKEERTVGDRVFTIITYKESEDGISYTKTVLFQENKVSYGLQLTGVEEHSNLIVEELITAWMNSFPQK